MSQPRLSVELPNITHPLTIRFGDKRVSLAGLRNDYTMLWAKSTGRASPTARPWLDKSDQSEYHYARLKSSDCV